MRLWKRGWWGVARVAYGGICDLKDVMRFSESIGANCSVRPSCFTSRVSNPTMPTPFTPSHSPYLPLKLEDQDIHLRNISVTMTTAVPPSASRPESKGPSFRSDIGTRRACLRSSVSCGPFPALLVLICNLYLGPGKHRPSLTTHHPENQRWSLVLWRLTSPSSLIMNAPVGSSWTPKMADTTSSRPRVSSR